LVPKLKLRVRVAKNLQYNKSDEADTFDNTFLECKNVKRTSEYNNIEEVSERDDLKTK
jgi:hypothetical protein